MQRARVRVMPQPSEQNHDHQPQGEDRPRVQSGMSLQELKAQTANRLALEGGLDGHANGESSENNRNTLDTAIDGGIKEPPPVLSSAANMHYPRHRQRMVHYNAREPAYHYGNSPHNAMQGGGGGHRNPNSWGPHQVAPEHISQQYPQHHHRGGHDYKNYGPPPPNYGGGGCVDAPIPNNYSNPEQTARNYTDSQLGITNQQIQIQQQQTPRMPLHGTVLKDRGSAENSVGSGGSNSGGGLAYGYENRGNARPTPLRAGRHSKEIYQSASAEGAAGRAKQPPPKEIRSPVGRHTPTREQLEGPVLFETPNPNQRRDNVVASTPSSTYSEPARSNPGGSHAHQTMTPNYNSSGMRSPAHPASHSRGSGGNTNQRGHQHQNQQSKLPHGLTVQELKEMTRARLAAEGDSPEGVSSDQSVHSVGTHGSGRGSRGGNNLQSYSNESVNTRNLVQSNDTVRFQGQQQHYNYPRHPSPVFGSGENQFNRHSPAFGLSCNHPRLQGDSWSPRSESNVMNNRGRCFSAEATMSSSTYEQQHQAASYYDNVPLTGAANRQRCATVSPLVMSRLHEDRPLLFSTDDKEKLAIPPLSEPRLRLHSTGGLNTHGTAMRAFSSTISPPPTPFVPIEDKANEEFIPQSPPPISMVGKSMTRRSKFGVNDRTISTGSAASGHGDIPSSMAEAVLASLTGASHGSIQAIGTSPFHSSEQGFIGESPYRPSESSDTSSSAFRIPGLVPESSGSMSLFSSGESHNIIFSPAEKPGDRMLLGALSWDGSDEKTSTSNIGGLTHDFGSLLNFSNGDVPLRGRAKTDSELLPGWLGGKSSLVSRMDPEHNAADTNGQQERRISEGH